MQPETKPTLDENLRSYATRRQAEAGDRLAPPPATRDRLLRAISRRGGLRQVRSKVAGRLQGVLTRPALAFAAAAIVVLLAALTFIQTFRPDSEPLVADAGSNADRRPESVAPAAWPKAPVARRVTAPPTPDSPAPATTIETPAAPDPTRTEIDRPLETTTEPASPATPSAQPTRQPSAIRVAEDLESNDRPLALVAALPPPAPISTPAEVPELKEKGPTQAAPRALWFNRRNTRPRGHQNLNSPPFPPVMERFCLRPHGQSWLVCDDDGSVYRIVLFSLCQPDTEDDPEPNRPDDSDASGRDLFHALAKAAAEGESSVTRSERKSVQFKAVGASLTADRWVVIDGEVILESADGRDGEIEGSAEVAVFGQVRIGNYVRFQLEASPAATAPVRLAQDR